MIAGIHQSNARQSPYNNMAAAIERRNYALDRMVDNDFITKAEADAREGTPIVTHGQPTPTPSSAPYFVETIRAQLEQRYGAKALYENGLVIRTGLDPELQRAATVALDDRCPATGQVARLPKAHAQRPGRTAHGRELPSPALDARDSDGDVIPAVVAGVTESGLRVRAGRLTGTIDKAGYDWTKRRPADLGRVGDLVEVRVLTARRRRSRCLHGDARTGSAAPGRRGRVREPDGPDRRDGRRRELRSQPVQPRHPGAATGRLAVQAVRLRGRDRPGLHHPVAPRRLTGELSRRPEPAAVRAEELRPRIPRDDHPA